MRGGKFTTTYYCDFCSKNQHEVLQLVAGPADTVHICDECIELAAKGIAEKRLGSARLDDVIRNGT